MGQKAIGGRFELLYENVTESDKRKLLPIVSLYLDEDDNHKLVKLQESWKTFNVVVTH